MDMAHHLSFTALSRGSRGGLPLVAGAMFALGVVTGAAVRPSLLHPTAAPVETVLTATPADLPAPAAAPASLHLDPRLAYPAEVLRIIDGDTFEARVRVWPGLDVNTKVRLRGIDAAELHARCDDERVKAEAARAALETILAEGGVAISRVGIDKYGGRVDATISTRNTADVSAAMLNGGWARSYDGGKRGSWCG
jgi:endonuclease YncB( thermonuclease family)